MANEAEDSKFNIMMLPAEIRSQILFFAFIGQERPDTDTLDSCRLVCKEWHEMIKRCVWLSPNKKWGIITMAMMEKNWCRGGSYPSDKMISHAKDLVTDGILPPFGVMKTLNERTREIFRQEKPLNLAELTFFASLAHHRLLAPQPALPVLGYSMRCMWLEDINVVSVPTHHLAALTSCVTGWVYIKNVSGCDLVSILENVKSKKLTLRRQCLGREETLALVQAMETRVERVHLEDEVTLDIEALAKYSGQGKCLQIGVFWREADDSLAKYTEKLTHWAKCKDWNKGTYYNVKDNCNIIGFTRNGNFLFYDHDL